MRWQIQRPGEAGVVPAEQAQPESCQKIATPNYHPDTRQRNLVSGNTNLLPCLYHQHKSRYGEFSFFSLLVFLRCYAAVRSQKFSPKAQLPMISFIFLRLSDFMKKRESFRETQIALIDRKRNLAVR